MTSKASSILAKIDERGRAVPRVQLKDISADEAELEQVELRSTGRYKILGQIAEGGIGQVLKARDTDLGRDVAMKVLREDRTGNPDLLRRFIEEAQIGGQLQHPGVVPVYEIGLHEGTRPYFAMKLVKGRTLAALIEKRNGPADRRRYFLSVFAQICQTMAYAHSRGVIHRDLKPANIMVGNFGEVQVVDWGFAKVLAEGGIADEKRAARMASDLTHIATLRSSGEGSESIAGSVMGTPAYMPPEQALGHIDELDQRTDVFSLGAILCEILTGAPVYRGEPEGLLVQAAQANTKDALQRLDRCGADPDLVALAKRCLAKLRQGRPGDAVSLAQRVTAHLSSAEERVQKSKLATIAARKESAAAKASTAQAKAKEQAARAEVEKKQALAERMRRQADRSHAEAENARRSRRQLMLLGAIVLLAMVGGGVSFALVMNGRQAEARRIAERVAGDLDTARRLKGEQKFGEALAAAGRGGESAVGTVQQEAAALVAAIEKDKRQAEAREARRLKEAAFLARLEEIRLEGTDGYEALETDRAYAALFAGQGIDLDRLSTKEAAKKIKRLKQWRRVVEALDDRIWLRGSWVDLKGSKRNRIVAVLRALDPDPWRNRVRDARDGGLTAIRPLADQIAKQSNPPAETLLLAGTALGVAGDLTAAIKYLGNANRDWPGHFWIAVRVGAFLGEQQRTTESARFRLANLAARPASVQVRADLAHDLRMNGDAKQALALSRETVRRNPKSPRARLALAIALFATGNKGKGEDVYRKAAGLAPGRAWVHVEWGEAVGGMGERKRQRAALNEALGVEPGLAHLHVRLGAELTMDGKYDAAIAQMKKAVKIEPGYYGGWLGLGVTYSVAGRHGDALAATQKAVELRPNDWAARASLGHALYSAGKREESLKEFQKSAELAPGQELAQVNLGDALQRAGDVYKAVKAYFRAIKINQTDITLTAVGSGLHTMGELGQAEIAAKEALARNPDFIQAQILLAMTFLDRGLVDRGIRELGKALVIDADDPMAKAMLAYAHLMRADPAKAMDLFQQAYQAKPGWGLPLVGIGRAREMQRDLTGAREAYERAWKARSKGQGVRHAAEAGCRLGRLLMRKGRFDEALTMLREADRLSEQVGFWYYPSSDWIEVCEQYVRLHQQLPAVRDGSHKPANAEEKAFFARMCTLVRDDKTAVRLFGEAIKEDSDLAHVSTGNRLLAARSAVRLALGKNTNAELSAKAIEWLTAEVRDQKEKLFDIDLQTRRWAREVLSDLRLDRDFAPLRTTAALSKLPEAQRGAWRGIWAEIDVALAKPGK